MNNHKLLWETSIFKWIQISVFIVLLFVPTWAYIEFDEGKIQILADETGQFASTVLKSLKAADNFFATKEYQIAERFATVAAAFIPYVFPIVATVGFLRAIFEETGDWKTELSKTVARETDKAIAENQVQLMKNVMDAIDNKLELFYDNSTTEQDLKTFTNIFHFEIDKMLNYFDDRKSLFKKYPLIGATPLIQLALLIAYFEPIAKRLTPSTATKPQLSCKMLTILQDYRPRTVYARLEKLRLKSDTMSASTLTHFSISTELYHVMSKQYNENGYRGGGKKINSTLPATMVPWRPSMDSQWLKKMINCKRCVAPGSDRFCFKDNLGTVEYSPTEPCIIDYAFLLRHRVEELFPVKLFQTMCNNNLPPKTGFGWLTMKLKDLRAHFNANGDECDLSVLYKNTCDPYVKLSIGEENWKTETVANNCCFDVDETYITQMISKDARVKIEVFDNDDTFAAYYTPDLVLRSEGNIDSFLTTGNRYVVVAYTTQYYSKGIPASQGYATNYIDTVSFWQEHYNMTKAKMPKGYKDFYATMGLNVEEDEDSKEYTTVAPHLLRVLPLSPRPTV